jgi:hypothetical protein
MEIVDKHMPVIEHRIRTDSEKWINDEVLSEMHQRDFLHRETLRSRQTSDWARYRAARNHVVKVIGKAFLTIQSINAVTNPRICGQD